MLWTYCDLQGHHRSKVLVPNKRLYMSSCLPLIATTALSGTVTEIYIDKQHFYNHGKKF